MRRVLGILLAAVAWVCLPCAGAAETELSVHKVFGDHMVLQRDREIRISGKAAAATAITVELAGNSAKAVADAAGKWQVALPALKAGGPYEVKITAADGKEIVLKDVLIGEVWMCSGQSNMEMPVWSGREFWQLVDGEQEAKNANYPMIRFFNVAPKKKVAPAGPVEETPGDGWQLCTPETVQPFSAAGYFFGRQLHRDLSVPVGLINSSWGGTPIESWISEEGYKSADRQKELAKLTLAKASPEKLKAMEADAQKVFAAWMEKFENSVAANSAVTANWKDADFDDSGWPELPAGMPFPFDIDGVVWYRNKVQIPESWAGKELVLSLGAIDDCDITYFNGVKVGQTTTDTPQYWSAKRVYKIPANLVKAGACTIAVRVADYYGGGGMTGPLNEMKIKPAGDDAAAVMIDKGWKGKLDTAVDIKKIGARPDPGAAGGLSSPHFPATLYNGMIAPWTVYPIRGAIWYQGESNAGAYEDYMTLMPLLIQDWRTKWNDPQLAFVLVQLASFQKHSPKARLADDFWVNQQPGDDVWSKLREVQTATLNVPNTGMAVAIDIGDHSDIHPTNKQAVGFRLAKEAERICYGLKEVSAGPLYSGMTVEGGKIRLSFTNVGGGLVAQGGEPKSFAIAGADGTFVWAKAAIEGENVVVWSDEVKEPTTVRYAWAMFPGNANLYNKEGFPASPFRTDRPAYLLKKQ